MTMKKSTELTLKDKLSRLTLREAVKLLGPEGEQLIRLGGTFEIVDFPGQVLLSHDRFELRLPEATVAISLKDDARRRLHWTCDACSRRCCGIPALTRSDPAERHFSFRCCRTQADQGPSSDSRCCTRARSRSVARLPTGLSAQLRWSICTER